MAAREQKKSDRLNRLMGEAVDVIDGIFHVYRAWWADILTLSLIIFVPLGLLGAADSHALESIGPGHDVKVLALIVGALAVTATGVLGEVFLAGAIGLSLTHAEDGRPPGIRFLTKHLKFGPLIVVDVLYVLSIAFGFVLLIIPGFAALVYFALAGPIVEIEQQGVKSAFRRSFRLVRGSYWLVFMILVPIEVLGESVRKGIEAACEALLGHSFIAVGLGEALAEVALSPLFAIAVVVLTRKMMQQKEGTILPGPSPAS